MPSPYTFSRISYRDLSMDQVVGAYVDWILGFDQPPTSRDFRLQAGIDDGWSKPQVIAGDDLRGAHDCYLQTRAAADQFLLRLLHREHHDPKRIWTTAVDITRDAVGVTVAHGAQMSIPDASQHLPPPSTPRIITALLAQSGRHALPRELSREVVDVPVADADEFLHHILMDQARVLPIVVLTPTHEGRWLLNGEAIARRTRGVVAVYRLVDRDATLGFNDALADRHFIARMGVMNGAVRFYDTKLTPQADPLDHPLWTVTRYTSVPNLDPNAYVGIAAARRQVTRSTPTNHYELIEEFDRLERSRRISEGRSTSQVEDLQGYLAIAQEQIATMVSDQDRLRIEHRQFEEDVQRRSESYEEELAGLRAKAAALEHAAARPTKVTYSAVNPEAMQALQGCMDPKRARLVDILHLAAMAFPARLVILSDAFSSAKKSDNFGFPEIAMSLLRRLGGEYAEALASGVPDGEARSCFGQNEFAANEGLLGAKGTNLRTFLYGGEDVVMLRHLKYGVTEGTATCLRIHFHWDGKEKRIVIGHCGRHLDSD